MLTRLSVIAGCAIAAGALTLGPADARTHDRGAVHALPALPALLGQRLTGSLLRATGIRWISSGRCARRENPHCTSFAGLRHRTLRGVMRLRARSHCNVVISGGTEAGHAPGRFSHHRGYKLDVLPNRCIARYVRRHSRRMVTRGDGARQWRMAGATFAREASHWDITFI